MAKRKRDSVTISSVEELPFLAARSANHPPRFNSNPPASFYLPQLSVPGIRENNDSNLRIAFLSGFSVKTLAAAIQNQCSVDVVKKYIANYHVKDIEQINKDGVRPVESMALNWHAIFFAIEQNCPKRLRVLLDIGADPNAMSASEPSLPAIVFAIISSKWTLRDPTEIVETLLAYGANPNSIPKFFWADFLQDLDAVSINKASIESSLRVHGLTVEDICTAPKSAWITDPGMNGALIDTFHLTLRYLFFRASEIPDIGQRRSEGYRAFDMENLLRLPYHTFQKVASKLVVDNVFAHQCMQTNLKKPLVMAFFGDPGHGQVELAEDMSKLLSVPFKAVDCSRVKSRRQLFTGPPKFHQHPDSATLDEFLSNVAGQRAIVFLDDFNDLMEKCPYLEGELLDFWQSGIHVDMVTEEIIDTSKIIWILNTKLGKEKVMRAFEHDLECQHGRPLRLLQDALMDKAIIFWGEAYKTILRTVVPFFIFTIEERIVAVHRLLLQLCNDVRRPIDMTLGINRYVGNVHLSISNATAMCEQISGRHYDRRLGAPAFFQSIEEIKTKLSAAHTQIKEKTVPTLKSFEISLGASHDSIDFDMESDTDSDITSYVEGNYAPFVLIVTDKGQKSPKRLVTPYY